MSEPLSHAKACQPFIILDTNSAIFLSNIELDGCPILLNLIRHYRIKVTQTVWKEFRKRIRPSLPNKGDVLRALCSCKDETDLNDCTRIIETSFRKNRRKHKGEKSAAALALWLSHSTSEWIIVVTDEFKILDSLKEIMRTQYAGTVIDSFDLLLFFFARHKKLLFDHMDSLLKDLKNQFQKPAKKDRESKAEKRYIDSWRMLKDICKTKKCQSQACYDVRAGNT